MLSILKIKLPALLLFCNSNTNSYIVMQVHNAVQNQTNGRQILLLLLHIHRVWMLVED